jgi:hypothetical protein
MPGTRSGNRPERPAAAEHAEAAKVIAAHENDCNAIGEHEVPFHRPRWHRAYSFGLITAGLFVFSWVGQFVTQYLVVRDETTQHGQAFEWSQFTAQFLASTFENWQSEFLQLLWQAGGLALFYFWGSSQSKEGDERIEQKLDLLLRDRGIDPTKL